MREEGFVIWLTGLPSSGKTTLAYVLKDRLLLKNLRVEVLDGDEVRRNLSPDLGFSKEDREVHARRVVYVSRLLARNGVITIVALISPYRLIREYARKIIGNFVEVWVKCPVEECVKRDPKGLYKRAREGKIVDMTGVQAEYEPPLNPEVTVETNLENPEECANKIMLRLRDLEYL